MINASTRHSTRRHVTSLNASTCHVTYRLCRLTHVYTFSTFYFRPFSFPYLPAEWKSGVTQPFSANSAKIPLSSFYPFSNNVHGIPWTHFNASGKRRVTRPEGNELGQRRWEGMQAGVRPRCTDRCTRRRPRRIR